MAKTRINRLVSPVVKWVGGKRQLLAEIMQHVPTNIGAYYEPFVGGGAVLFRLQPQRAVINDINSEIINVYRVIKSKPEELIEELRCYQNEKDYYYEVREKDRDKDLYNSMSDIEKASRVLFLNKTCYNGLYRVNSSGEFNSPFGYYKNPNITNETTIKAVSKYFQESDIDILNQDYEDVVKSATKNDFVYLDPPYYPISDSSSFTGYTRNGFDEDQQERLKKVCDCLDRSGVKFLLSNSYCPFIKELYKGYEFVEVSAKRAVNSNPHNRGEIKEYLVKNYE
jgi:DNA adenine methylase